MPKFVDAVDFQNIAVINEVTQNLASAPVSPVVGRRYFDTTLNSEFVWNGTTWAELDATKLSALIPNGALITNPLARANHTGTQLASTISNFAAAADALTLDSFTAPIANVSMGGFKITNVATPTATTDGTNKSYVDSSVQSAAAGIVSKQAVAVVSTANIATLSGLLTVDGVSLVAGNRVLLVAQTVASANGVYIVSAGAWTRSVNDANAELDLGATWFVEQGTLNNTSTWRLATPTSGVITAGTTAITVTQLTAAQTYTASNGAQLIGSNFSALYGAGLTLSGNNLIVDTTVIPKKYATTIGDGTTTSYSITHNLGTTDIQVTTRLIATGEQIVADNVAVTTNTATVSFVTAPALNTYRVIVSG
jgi:hypothetical protein